jgi:hypothetical protein
MKPTSEQTRNGVLSAVPLPPEDLLVLKTLFGYTTTSAQPATESPRTVDPSCAYGCVDWYIYPDSDSKIESAAA